MEPERPAKPATGAATGATEGATAGTTTSAPADATGGAPDRSGRPFLVGLTGGIGTGKSTAADRFAEHGIALIDADLLAHQLTGAQGPAMPAIQAEFGDEYVTPEGALDRARMRALAFADDGARLRLEAILHPRIRAATEAAIRAAASPYVVLVIPLLFESPNWRERVDRAVVVDCPEAQQVERVVRRSGLTEAMVRAIMGRQVDRATRRRLADDILDNSHGPAELRAAVDVLHARYLALAAAKQARGL